MSIFRKKDPAPLDWTLLTAFRKGVEQYLDMLPPSKIQALDEYTTATRNRLAVQYGMDLNSEREIFAFTAGVLRALITANNTRALYPEAESRLLIETTARTVGVLIRDLLQDVPGVPPIGDTE